MIIAAWLLLLALLTLFFNNYLEKQRNPNRHLAGVAVDSDAVVVLKRNRQGHYVASGSINGTPVEFMLDTGATDVSIPAVIAGRLGLERGRAVHYRTANGTIAAWQTQLDEVRLGPLRLGPVDASINPHMQGEAILLGMSFLRHLDFSQQGNTLTLRHTGRSH